VPSYYWIYKYFHMAIAIGSFLIAITLYFAERSGKADNPGQRRSRFVFSLVLAVFGLAGFLLCVVAAILSVVVFLVYIPNVFKYVSATCGDGPKRALRAYCDVHFPSGQTHSCYSNFTVAHQQATNFLKTFSFSKVVAAGVNTWSCIQPDDWNAAQDFADDGKNAAIFCGMLFAVAAILYNYSFVYAIEQAALLCKSQTEIKAQNQEVAAETPAQEQEVAPKTPVPQG